MSKGGRLDVAPEAPGADYEERIRSSFARQGLMSMLDAKLTVLSTEFKINLLAPAMGDRIVARGRVVKSGRTLTIAQSEVFAETGGEEKLIALLTATLMTVEARDGIRD
jgi:acyl-coenzyme A thioesterase PaaI-like protein